MCVWSIQLPTSIVSVNPPIMEKLVLNYCGQLLFQFFILFTYTQCHLAYTRCLSACMQCTTFFAVKCVCSWYLFHPFCLQVHSPLTFPPSHLCGPSSSPFLDARYMMCVCVSVCVCVTVFKCAHLCDHCCACTASYVQHFLFSLPPSLPFLTSLLIPRLHLCGT